MDDPVSASKPLLLGRQMSVSVSLAIGRPILTPASFLPALKDPHITDPHVGKGLLHEGSGHRPILGWALIPADTLPFQVMVNSSRDSIFHFWRIQIARKYNPYIQPIKVLLFLLPTEINSVP